MARIRKKGRGENNLAAPGGLCSQGRWKVSKLTRENRLFLGCLQASPARERPQSSSGLASLRLSDFQSADLLQGEEGEPSSADFGSSERLGSWREEDVRPNAGVRWDQVGRRPKDSPLGGGK